MDFSGLPGPERAALVDRFGAWTASLRQAGRLCGVGRLEGGGRIVRRGGPADDPGHSLVRASTPRIEPADPLAVGLHVIEATDDDEAVELAGTCPIVELGGSVEVREVRASLR